MESGEEEEKTYYDVLCLSSPTCSMSEIKRAYRSCALVHHPDRSSSLSEERTSTEFMQRINEAKETLLDEDKRRTYNQRYGFSTIWEESVEFEIQQRFYEDTQSRAFRNHFEELPPVVFNKDITVAEWMDPDFLLRLDYTYYRTDSCVECEGYGWKPVLISSDFLYKDITMVCPQCSGKGYTLEEYMGTADEIQKTRKRRRRQSSSLLDVSLPLTTSVDVCTRCYGVKRVLMDKEMAKSDCSACGGLGSIRQLFHLKGTVPAPRHLDEKTRIGVVCVREMGNRMARGNRRGDVHIVVRVGEGKQSFVVPVEICAGPLGHRSCAEDPFGRCPSDELPSDEEEEDHSCEEQECVLGGLCVRKVCPSFECGLNQERYPGGPGVSSSIRFKPCPLNGIDLVGDIHAPFYTALTGLGLEFPVDLHHPDQDSTERIRVTRVYKDPSRREISWTGDSWTISGWGPPVCKGCSLPTFMKDYQWVMDSLTRDARGVSTFIPSFAPSLYVNLGEDGYTETQCCFSFCGSDFQCRTNQAWKDVSPYRRPDFGDMVVRIHVNRPMEFIVHDDTMESDEGVIADFISFIQSNKHTEYGPRYRSRTYQTSISS